MAQIINFSTNWNNKLTCLCFTAIRASSRMAIGETVEIHLKNKYMFSAIVLDKKRILGKDLTEGVCRIDTGFSKDVTLKIIGKMYRQSEPEIFPIYWYLLEAKPNPLRVEAEKQENQLFK